jgi:hypothetical protein
MLVARENILGGSVRRRRRGAAAPWGVSVRRSHTHGECGAWTHRAQSRPCDGHRQRSVDPDASSEPAPEDAACAAASPASPAHGAGGTDGNAPIWVSANAKSAMNGGEVDRPTPRSCTDASAAPNSAKASGSSMAAVPRRACFCGIQPHTRSAVLVKAPWDAAGLERATGVGSGRLRGAVRAVRRMAGADVAAGPTCVCGSPLAVRRCTPCVAAAGA